MRRFRMVNSVRFGVCCVFLLALLVTTQSLQVKAAPGDEVYTLLLKTGQFVPPAGSRSLPSPNEQHLIIQFEEGVLEEDVDALADIGVEVLSAVPRNAVLAHVPAGTDLGAIEGVRWAGALSPIDKISPLIDMSLDKGFFLLDLHADVDGATGAALVEAAGGVVTLHPDLPPTTILVEGDFDVVNLLAQSDEVSYLYPADDAIINGESVFFCPGPLTEFGATARFAIVDPIGWDGLGLGSFAGTFHFKTGTPDVPGSTEEAIVASAINEWGVFADLNFTATGSVDANSSIEIFWAVGNHDVQAGFSHSEFDGPSNILAHAYVPNASETRRGDIHFDEDEDWAAGAQSGFDLFTVALHEAGHSHGLGHSDDVNAVMFPSVRGIVTKLHADDIAGIQTVYATPSGIEVYDPDGGESLNAGSTKTIAWNDGADAGANVSIALLKSGVFQGFISASTPNDGAFVWSIPSGMTTSSAYTVRVQSLSTPAITDTSESVFTINEVTKTTFSFNGNPDVIPDNTGLLFASFTDIVVPGGVGTLVDIEITNIRINYGNMSDLEFRLIDPVSLNQNRIVLSGHCSGSALSSAVPFGLDDDAASSIGSACPPTSGISFIPDFSLNSPVTGISPVGTWTLVVFDRNLAAGAGGTVVGWDLVIGTSAADPGQFTPVHVDASDTSPGSGTVAQPYTVVTPGITTVTNSGEVRIHGGTYNDAPITIAKPLTMTRTVASVGVVSIQ